MGFVGIVLIGIFDALLCMREIPKMRREKLNKELWLFSILLIAGTGLTVLVAMGIKLPNPCDWVKAAYSPIYGFMKSLLG